MKESLRLLSLSFALCAFSFSLAYAQSQTSEELIKNYRLYEGKPVVFSGEVIGDVMLRGDHAWVNVNDGLNAIGVWMPSELARQIQSSGSYKSKGDFVEVTGIFNHSCSQHGGDLDIHAQALRRLNPGSIVRERLNPGKRDLAVILGAILCLVSILSLLNRK